MIVLLLISFSLVWLTLYWIRDLKLLHNRTHKDFKNKSISTFNRKKLKGIEGERRVYTFLSKTLDKTTWYIFNDVRFYSNNRCTQIDHVVVSKFGIFVIETKNITGNILGSVNDTFWNSLLSFKSYQFYNPIKQNQGHINSLKYNLEKKLLLHLDNTLFYSLIVFPQYSLNAIKIKGNLGNNTSVVSLNDLQKYFNQFTYEVLSLDVLQDILKILEQHSYSHFHKKLLGV